MLFLNFKTGLLLAYQWLSWSILLLGGQVLLSMGAIVLPIGLFGQASQVALNALQTDTAFAEGGAGPFASFLASFTDEAAAANGFSLPEKGSADVQLQNELATILPADSLAELQQIIPQDAALTTQDSIVSAGLGADDIAALAMVGNGLKPAVSVQEEITEGDAVNLLQEGLLSGQDGQLPENLDGQQQGKGLGDLAEMPQSLTNAGLSGATGNAGVQQDGMSNPQQQTVSILGTLGSKGKTPLSGSGDAVVPQIDASTVQDKQAVSDQMGPKSVRQVITPVTEAVPGDGSLTFVAQAESEPETAFFQQKKTSDLSSTQAISSDSQLRRTVGENAVVSDGDQVQTVTSKGEINPKISGFGFSEPNSSPVVKEGDETASTQLEVVKVGAKTASAQLEKAAQDIIAPTRLEGKTEAQKQVPSTLPGVQTGGETKSAEKPVLSTELKPGSQSLQVSQSSAVEENAKSPDPVTKTAENFQKVPVSKGATAQLTPVSEQVSANVEGIVPDSDGRVAVSVSRTLTSQSGDKKLSGENSEKDNQQAITSGNKDAGEQFAEVPETVLSKPVERPGGQKFEQHSHSANSEAIHKGSVQPLHVQKAEQGTAAPNENRIVSEELVEGKKLEAKFDDMDYEAEFTNAFRPEFRSAGRAEVISPAQTYAQAQSGHAASQVAAAMVRTLRNGDTKFQMRFDPPELGRVDVKMKVSSDGTVHAHLIVERPETLDMFMRDQRGLERALEAAGLNTNANNLQFSLKDQGGQGFAFSQGENQSGQQGQGQQRRQGAEAQKEHSIEQVTQIYTSRGQNGLDIRV